MGNFDVSEIVARLKWGGNIEAHELSLIRMKLLKPETDDDIYDLIIAIGLSVSPNDIDIKTVEKYLYNESDILAIQAAVKTLCGRWELTDNYIDRLIYLAGVDQWETFSDVSITALYNLGLYVYKTKNSRVLKFLIATYEYYMASKKIEEFSVFHLRNVYFSLMLSVLGFQAVLNNQIPFEKNIPPEEFDEAIIERVKKLI